MKGRAFMRRYLPVYIAVAVVMVVFAAFWGKTAQEAMLHTEAAPYRIVIDPGHGGEDGGAVSCTGIEESRINLEISRRLDDLLHLMGYDTLMIRQDDVSIHTEGDSIAQKKVSDLRNRVKIVNSQPKALLISIHQNHFPNGKYAGAQVFYAPDAQSKDLAQRIQCSFLSNLNPESHREEKEAEGIYLMNHIRCSGVLVECGFLSNIEEEARLRDPEYQKAICCIVATCVAEWIRQGNSGRIA